VSRYLSGPPAAAPSQAPEVRNLARAVIDTQVELARRRLEAGDFADAARKAEGALKLDPESAAAREVFDAATQALKKVDAAVASIQAAGGDRERLAAAAFELMTIDPGHPEAEKAAAAAGPPFRSRAEQARGLARQERQKAGQAGADRSSQFARGLDLERQGERALEAGQLATAARRFVEARGCFERARSGSR
jgi:tetratricopeptide (TPR) repeat protein